MTRTSRSRTPSRSETGSSISRTRGAWCRAGTSATSSVAEPDTGAGYLNCFNIGTLQSTPPLLWRLHLSDGAIESTPAVWHGWIYVGARDGGIYGIADP